MSIKALLFGFFYILVLGLSIQLVFLFLAIGYNDLLKDSPLAASIVRIAFYGLGTVVYFFLMASAGYITASIAKVHVVSHGLVVSIAAIGLSLFSSLKSDEFTWVSLVFFALGVTFTLTGVYRWQRSDNAIKQS